MKRSNRRSNKASRVGPASTKYVDVVTDKLATSASNYKTQYTYNVKQLLPSLQASKTRLVRMRRFHLTFSPTEAALGVSLQQVGIQLEAIDPVTGNPVPVTKLMTLSETNPKNLSFTIGSEFSRWNMSDDGFKPLVISVFNIASVPTVTDFTVTIRTEIDLQIPEPTAV